MDILTMIASAIGGIFIWNLLFSRKNTNVCEASSKETIDPWLVKCAIRDTFGTTDIPAALEIAQKCPDPKPDTWLVECAIRETFGTTNLDYVFENYMSKETRKKLEQQLMQR